VALIAGVVVMVSVEGMGGIDDDSGMLGMVDGDCGGSLAASIDGSAA
jgi:hypothetical protein